MSCLTRYCGVKTLCLSFTLLIMSTMLQAEPMGIVMVSPEQAANTANRNQRDTYAYPKWPTSQQVSKEIIPPPPGPYMSLALNDMSVGRSSFARAPKQYTSKLEPASVPMEAFSPDVPWPENLRPAKRWVPVDGYHYVQPKVTKSIANRSFQVTKNNSSSGYATRYRRSSDMKESETRWMPPMGTGSY